jgi:hypothetical protein
MEPAATEPTGTVSEATAAHVLAVLHGFEMGRVDAGTVTAQVVKF